jgi:hypothetical protein
VSDRLSTEPYGTPHLLSSNAYSRRCSSTFDWILPVQERASANVQLAAQQHSGRKKKKKLGLVSVTSEHFDFARPLLPFTSVYIVMNKEGSPVESY